MTRRELFTNTINRIVTEANRVKLTKATVKVETLTDEFVTFRCSGQNTPDIELTKVDDDFKCKCYHEIAKLENFGNIITGEDYEY